MKSIFLLIAILISANISFSQQLTEKLIKAIDTSLTVDIEASKYDRPTGSYFIKAYAKDRSKHYYFTPPGMSPPFTKVLIAYHCVFDKSGNVYYAGAEHSDSSPVKYYLMKNDDIVKDYYDISADYLVCKDVLYFKVSSTEGMFRIFQADLVTGNMHQSAEYSSIDFPFDFGRSNVFQFTSGMRPVFVASESGSNSLMYPGEGTYFDGRTIQPWISLDKRGTYVFIASRGENKDFIMQGETDFPPADKIYPPVLFDSINRPVYNSYKYVYNSKSISKVFAGDVQIGRTYSLISSLQITPRGKIAYVGNIYGADNSTIDSSFIVINGTEIKKFAAVSSLKFTPDDVPVYTASQKPKGKLDVYIGSQKTDSAYIDVIYLTVLPGGRLSYMGFKSDTEFIYKIGKASLGPFYNYTAYITGNVENYFQYDQAGNYAFASSSKEGTSFGDGHFSNNIYVNDSSKGITMNDINYFKLAWPHVIASGYSPGSSVLSVIYDNSKIIGGGYDKTSDFDFNEKTNTLSFVGQKGNDVYYCEIKL